MPVSGPQRFLRVGHKVFIQRDSEGTTHFPTVELGVISNVADEAATENVQLRDPWDGVNKTVAESITDQTEAYNITVANVNARNLSLMLLAKEPEEFTQAAVQVTDVSHVGSIVGDLVKVRAAPTGSQVQGTPVYNLATIDTVKIGATTLTLNTDYQVVDANMGFIRLLPTAQTGVVGAAVTLLITYTPNALSGLRLIKPQTAGNIYGTVWVFRGADGGAIRDVREARMSIAPSGGNWDVANYATLGLRATVLSDPSTPTQPAGRYIAYHGTVPARS